MPLRLVRSSKPEMPPRESLTYPPPMVTSSPTLAAPSHPARGSCRPELAGRTRANTGPSRRGLARPSAGGCSFSRLGPACRRAAKPGPPRPRAPKNTLAGAPRTGLSPFGGPFLEHRESLLGPPPDIAARDHARCLARASGLRFGGDGQLRVEGVLRARGDCPQPPGASVFGGARCSRRGWANSPGHRPGGHCRCRWRRPHRATRRSCPTPRATAAP